jgi:tetrahydromethanopterin S-methyltransferase subunit G
MADTSSSKTEGNELEHLRDILYGERVRSIESRLDEIDQRISRNTTELNHRVDHEVEELSKRLDALGKRFDECALALQSQEAADINAIGKRFDERLLAFQNQEAADMNAIEKRLDEQVLAFQNQEAADMSAIGKRLDEQALAFQNQEAADVNAIGKRLDAQSADQAAALKKAREALQADMGNMADEIRAWREKIGQMVSALGNAWTDSEPSK